MKKIFFSFILLLAAVSLFAQTEITGEGTNKVIRGFMSQKELSSDASFSWFAENAKGYTPDATALQAFKANKDSIYILAFGGTWCGDTRYLLPKFFALTDAAGIPQDHITLLGVDRSKKTVHHLAETFKVERVPTFIILKNGEEIGRVVEYGKTGMFDRELGEIVNGKK